MEKELNGKMLVIPEHVAIILDGNGRWAKKRLMPRNYGHSQGAKTVEQKRNGNGNRRKMQF